jgi:hypothetical protein
VSLLPPWDHSWSWFMAATTSTKDGFDCGRLSPCKGFFFFGVSHVNVHCHASSLCWSILCLMEEKIMCLLLMLTRLHFVGLHGHLFFKLFRLWRRVHGLSNSLICNSRVRSSVFRSKKEGWSFILTCNYLFEADSSQYAHSIDTKKANSTLWRVVRFESSSNGWSDAI